MQNRPRQSGFHNSRTGWGILAAGPRAILIVALLFAMNPQPVRAQCEYSVTIIQAPDCGFTGPPATTGTAINSFGHVVGPYPTCVEGYSRAFLWTPEDGFQMLPMPAGASQLWASDINDAGTIVGTVTFGGIGWRGFVYENGVYTILPPVFDMPGAWSSAGAINSSGTVVGTRSITKELNPQNAFVWSRNGGFIDLGLMGYGRSDAHD